MNQKAQRFEKKLEHQAKVQLLKSGMPWQQVLHPERFVKKEEITLEKLQDVIKLV